MDRTKLINDFNINNYNAFLIKRGTRRGGGVVIFTNKNLSSTLAESEYVVVDNILECVTIELTIKNHTNVVVRLILQNCKIYKKYYLCVVTL